MMKKVVLVLGTVMLLAGCAGRWEPFGAFTDPVCMPDGSVSFYQQPDANGQLGKPLATKENCSWNKPAAK